MQNALHEPQTILVLGGTSEIGRAIADALITPATRTLVLACRRPDAAQPEHFAFVRRPILLMDLDSRSFVEKVDFITSAGHLSGGNSRREAGLGEGGPAMVVTDKAVFDFAEETREMRLKSLHPGVTKDEVLAAMSFVPLVPETIPETEAPTAEELGFIREDIDPNRILLKV